MKLDPTLIEYISNVVKTAKIVGIDGLKLEPDFIGGLAEDNTTYITQLEDIPDMPFDAMCIRNLNVFQSRFEIARKQDNFEMIADVNDEGFVRSVLMRGKGTKIDFRCSTPKQVKAPRGFKSPLVNRVKLTGETVMLLQQAIASMGSDVVTIISNNGVSFEIVDVNNDVFKHNFEFDVESLDGEDNTNFAHRYPAKKLLGLFKINPTATFDVSDTGRLCINVNGFDVTILPIQ